MHLNVEISGTGGGERISLMSCRSDRKETNHHQRISTSTILTSKEFRVSVGRLERETNKTKEKITKWARRKKAEGVFNPAKGRFLIIRMF